MRSIVQRSKDECFVCGSTRWLEEHHIIYFAHNRKNSEKYGLKVMLCKDHHTEVHQGTTELRHTLEVIAQDAFEKEFPDKDFKDVFGKYVR